MLGVAAGGGADLYAPHPPKRFRAGVRSDSRIRPARAGDAAARPSARIFTHDQWGDYLIYRLYPAHKVFIDGRSDFYGDDFEKKYLDVLNVKYGWEKTLTGSASTRFSCPPTRP